MNLADRRQLRIIFKAAKLNSFITILKIGIVIKELRTI